MSYLVPCPAQSAGHSRHQYGSSSWQECMKAATDRRTKCKGSNLAGGNVPPLDPESRFLLLDMFALDRLGEWERGQVEGAPSHLPEEVPDSSSLTDIGLERVMRDGFTSAIFEDPRCFSHEWNEQSTAMVRALWSEVKDEDDDRDLSELPNDMRTLITQAVFRHSDSDYILRRIVSNSVKSARRFLIDPRVSAQAREAIWRMGDAQVDGREVKEEDIQVVADHFLDRYFQYTGELDKEEEARAKFTKQIGVALVEVGCASSISFAISWAGRDAERLINREVSEEISVPGAALNVYRNYDPTTISVVPDGYSVRFTKGKAGPLTDFYDHVHVATEMERHLSYPPTEAAEFNHPSTSTKEIP